MVGRLGDSGSCDFEGMSMPFTLAPLPRQRSFSGRSIPEQVTPREIILRTPNDAANLPAMRMDGAIPLPRPARCPKLAGWGRTCFRPGTAFRSAPGRPELTRVGARRYVQVGQRRLMEAHAQAESTIR